MSKYSHLSKEELLKLIEKQEQELKSKKYGLVWDSEREPEQVVLDCKNHLPVLKRVKSKEIKTDDSEDNILIEGDNYHALTVLNYTHKGKIDVIYIDPPYNTGNKDFIYNDKYVEKDDGYRHSKWLNFMEKRLKLAKELLKTDGVIFVSIDDNEYAQLKLLMDKIFGERNFLETFHIQVRYSTKSLNEKDDFQKLIEYILIYAKNKALFKPNKPKKAYDLSKFVYEIKELGSGKEIKLGGKKVKIFKKGEYEIIKHKKGNIKYLKATWASGSVLKGNTSGKFFHNFLENRKNNDGIGTLYKVYGIGDDGLGYRYFTGPKKINTTKGLFYSGIPTSRRLEIEKRGSSEKELPIKNFYDYSADFGNIRHEGGVGFRSGKKPVKLLKFLINLHKSKNINVLDFFAGSGTTGHAVLELNKEDGGNRKFILVTNNEGNIATEVCYPRLKNVIKGYNKNGNGEWVEGLGGNLQYFKTSLIKKSKNRDQVKIDLTQKATEMLCVKENIYNLEKEGEDYKIFSSNKKDRFLCIYYNFIDDSFNKFLEELKKLNNKKIIYMFAIDNKVDKSLFSELDDFTIEPIPQKILDVYNQLVKMNIPIKVETIFIDLEKAKKQIFENEDKDTGAKILRVVLEKLLQKIAQLNQVNILNDKGKEIKISNLNDILKAKNVLSQVEWQENQTYLVIGNHASHGEYDEYSLEQVKNFYKHVQYLIEKFNI